MHAWVLIYQTQKLSTVDENIAYARLATFIVLKQIAYIVVGRVAISCAALNIVNHVMPLKMAYLC